MTAIRNLHSELIEYKVNYELDHKIISSNDRFGINHGFITS